jgi:hypothetical protein
MAYKGTVIQQKDLGLLVECGVVFHCTRSDTYRGQFAGKEFLCWKKEVSKKRKVILCVRNKDERKVVRLSPFTTLKELQVKAK